MSDVGVVKIEVDGYECERCGHRWIGRSPRVHDPSRKGKDAKTPRMCPSCKSVYWNVPVEKKK